jgi:hypothetical protein
MRDRYTLTDVNTIYRHKGIRIGTLWYSRSNGTGDITISDEFDALDEVTKIDVLKDLFGLLEREIDIRRSKIRPDLLEILNI